MSTEGLDSGLSQSQINALRITNGLSGCLSAIGSLCILTHIIVGKKITNPYHRIVLGLSVADFISSVTLAIVAPIFYEETLQPGPACTANGWFVVFGYSAALYNAALSFNFLLEIYYEKSNNQIRAYEIVLHLVAILYPAGMAFIGLFLEVYNPTTLGCWITEYPEQCSEAENVDCLRGEDAWEPFLYAAAAVPLSFAWISIIVCNVLIYRKVKRIQLQSEQYQFRSSTLDSNEQQSTEAPQKPEGAVISTSIVASRSGSSSLRPTAESENRERKRKQESNKKLRLVATQSFLFVAAYAAVYFFSVLEFTFESIDPEGHANGKYYPNSLLESIFLPLQGFFDCFVYFRPKYLKVRKLNPSMRALEAVRRTIFFTTPARAIEGYEAETSTSSN